MPTQLIELKKPLDKFKAGQRIRATPDELKASGLEPGKDYEPLGTYPTPTPSDLSPTGDTP